MLHQVRVGWQRESRSIPSPRTGSKLISVSSPERTTRGQFFDNVTVIFKAVNNGKKEKFTSLHSFAIFVFYWYCIHIRF